MQLVNVTNDEIRLNSMLDEYIFGKTRYDSVINQQGIIFTCDSYENNRYHFSQQPFAFETIRADYVPGYTSPLVFYCTASKGFLNEAKTLLSYFEAAEKSDSTAEEKEQCFEAGFAVASLLTQAAVEKIQLPQIGAGGILVQLAGKDTKLLFLPEALYKTSSAGLQRTEDANQNGLWINSTLYDLPAICFQRGVISYKMLTGRYPFTATELDERNADILDRKFLPLELSVNGINQQLADEINRSLKLTSSASTRPGKKQKGKASEDLTPVAEFPLELLYQCKNNTFENKISDEEFAQKVSSFEKKQNSKVTVKRSIRRNTVKIIIGVVVAAALTAITINTRNTKLKEYTPTGLSSVQVIEGFLRGVNEKDTSLLQNFSKGKTAALIQKTVSQIYVIDKQRTIYDGDHGFPPPAEWLLYLSDESQWQHSSVYGVTGLTIDGEPGDLTIPLKAYNEKPEPIKEEAGRILKNKDQVTHDVSYYVIHTEGEDNMIFVELCTDKITLTWKNNHWLITEMNTTSEKLHVNTAEFLLDWFEMLRLSDMDTGRTAELLSYKYPWLPTAKDVSYAKAFIESQVQQIFRELHF